MGVPGINPRRHPQWGGRARINRGPLISLRNIPFSTPYKSPNLDRWVSIDRGDLG